jgi:hypothetical protein
LVEESAGQRIQQRSEAADASAPVQTSAPKNATAFVQCSKPVLRLCEVIEDPTAKLRQELLERRCGAR